MRTREEVERIEEDYLAPYAMKSSQSVGRIYQETDHPTRTCYQRDRDRIVHSAAFRKLEYKTQVFVIFEGDYYRTRLTHTIEVAQIARTLGRSLKLNEDLIEAIALAHDLGHPPFGHAGEYALNDILQELDKGMKFNHNFRSYEIVHKLEKKYADYAGLNLSIEVLVGILKHETVYDDIKKDETYDARLGEGPTLEAQVVDIADWLAYLSHDIDDGLTSGCITVSDLMESDLWKRVCEKAGLSRKSLNDEMMKYQIVKALIEIQTRDFLEFSSENLKKLNFSSVQEVKAHKDKVLGFSPQMKQEREQLQKLLFEKFYRHYRVERMTSKGRRIIRDIFRAYDDNPEQLPYEVYERNREYSKQQRYKIICNYIASMTDRAAFDEHKKLFDPYKTV